jgi:serine/threonine protein kinase
VAIYVMLKTMGFWTGDDHATLSSDEEAWRHILRRHISYFADEDGFQGLLEHIGEENPFIERLVALAAELKPREPFGLWEYVDARFRDLIVKMTNLDPARRISAREVLEHPWFAGQSGCLVPPDESKWHAEFLPNIARALAVAFIAITVTVIPYHPTREADIIPKHLNIQASC